VGSTAKAIRRRKKRKEGELRSAATGQNVCGWEKKETDKRIERKRIESGETYFEKRWASYTCDEKEEHTRQEEKRRMTREIWGNCGKPKSKEEEVGSVKRMP